MSRWNGIHSRPAYFLCWPYGMLDDNLMLPMTPGSVKQILILFRFDHRVFRGPGKNRAPGCQEQEFSQAWMGARRAPAQGTPNRCWALSSCQSTSLNAAASVAFISNQLCPVPYRLLGRTTTEMRDPKETQQHGFRFNSCGYCTIPCALAILLL